MLPEDLPNQDLESIPAMEVVSPSLHEQTLDQVLLTPVVVSSTDRVTLRVHDILGNGRLRRVIKYIGTRSAAPGQNGKAVKISQTSIFATAIIHGFAILDHENAELFEEIELIHNDTATTDYPMFEEMCGNLKAAANYGNDTLCAHLSNQEFDKLAERAALLNISPSEFATACLLASMNGVQDISPEVKKKIDHKCKHFLYSCNVLLDFLKKCKY